MDFQSVNYNDLFNQVAKKLINRAGITNIGPTSKTSALVSAVLQEEKNKFNLINSVLESLKLESAFGEDLDKIGLFFGVKRLESARAKTNIIDKNLEFYVDSGTFGSINNSNSFTIPANTLVYLESKDSTSSSTVQFRVLNDINCDKDAASVYFAGEAIETGAASNVAAGALNKHGFTSYTNSASKLLKVRNNYSIVNGRDSQLDSSYRYAISKAITAYSGCNETTLKLAVRTFPGVVDSKFIRNYNGIGSSAIFVDTIEGTIPDSLLTAIRERLALFASASETIYVYAPKYVKLSLNLVVKTTKDLSTEDKTTLTNNINTTIKNYFAALRMGETLDLEYLYNFIIKNNTSVTKIGRNNNGNKAEEISVYYSDSLGNSFNKKLIENNLSVSQEQRIVLLETDNPITISIEK